MGSAGHIINNADHYVLQYCDGTNWIAMGQQGAAVPNGQNASDALGQFASLVSDATVVYTTNGDDNNNDPTVSALGFNTYQLWGSNPEGIALDAVNHRLFVADYTNNRVLEYNLNSDNSIKVSPGHTATHVLGQVNFTNYAVNQGNANSTQSSMSAPEGLAFDANNNRLFVGDDGNARVLVYNTATITDGMNAAYVLGQPDFNTNTPNYTDIKLGDPQGLAYDAVHSRLFVAEYSGARVVVFLLSGGISNGMAASYDLGPPGGLLDTTNGVSQSLMNSPQGVAYDAINDRLFVALGYNSNRVMVFSTATITNGENASYVLGQPNWTSNGLATTQAGMANPVAVAFNATNNSLFVADTQNNRILVFNVAPGYLGGGGGGNGENASNVLGQTDFVSMGSPTTQAGLNNPGGLAFDAATGRLFETDESNNRIMVFNIGCSGPASVEGTMMYNNGSHLYQFCDGTNWKPMGPTSAGGAGCSSPAGNEGNMFYNSDFNVMEYCNGAGWVGISK